MAAADNADRGEYEGVNPWLIAVLVAIATFMEVLDTTITNVALRYMSGGLAVSSDEASWVITTYLVANSVVLCASGWIAEMFGRKNFFLVCIALFTVSSLLCGIAWNLQVLLLFRITQGLAGGGMTPVAQSILAAAFPPAKRAQGFALYGIAVVVAPILGPTLGGWLSDNLSWHWCFLINVPVGIASTIAIYYVLPQSAEKRKKRAEMWKKGLDFDLVGFLLIAAFLGSLEVIFDRGQIDDWFGSSVIVSFTVLAVVSLVLFVPWELSRERPLIDLRLLTGRQFGTCFIIMFATGALLIATTQILPQLLQEQFQYTATLAGLAISPGGFVTIMMMFLVGRLSAIQPKYLISVGAAIAGCAMLDLMRTSPDADFWFFALSRILISAGIPLIFIPITTASYNGIPQSKTDQASALINLARNFGGSVGVSLSQTMLARREQFHQVRLGEHVGAWNPFYWDTLNHIQAYINSQAATGNSTATSLAYIGQMIQGQVSILSYNDVFFMLAIMAAVMIPLALSLKSVDPSARPVAAH